MSQETTEALYAWQELDDDGRWGTIATIVPAISSQPVPLVFRDQAVAEQLRAFAQITKDGTGHDVRLRRFAHDSSFPEVVL